MHATITEQLGHEARWYAVYTKAGDEQRTASNLRAGSIETFAPRRRERRMNRVRCKVAYVVKPLFPRYLFARFNVQEALWRVRYTRGVHSVVSFGAGPSAVRDELIELLREQGGEDGVIRVGEELHEGDRVRIREGPFKNFEGVFSGRMQDNERVRILLSAVSYQSHIIIDRDALKKLDNGTRADARE